MWLINNHRRKHRAGWYTVGNLRRLWNGLRTGNAPGTICHATDTESECAGSLLSNMDASAMSVPCGNSNGSGRTGSRGRVMSALSMRVEVVAGEHISKAVWQACEMAQTLNLHHVQFDANDAHYACYPRGAMRLEEGRKGRWEWEKMGVWWGGREIEWEYVGPIVETAK